MINSASFSRLKLLCVNLLSDCSLENIKKLEEAVNELDSESVQLLQEFILVPFQAHLTVKLSEKVTIKCIEFFTVVFKKSCVKQWPFFVRHFSLMMSKICDPQDINSSVTARSEELKLSICENLLWLVKCSSVDVLNEMYSLSFRPHLGYALFVFNALLRLEKSKSLIKAVLSTIGALTYSEDYVGKKDLITKYIASEALASCLPGISVALQKVICNDDKQGHSVIIMALSILTDLIVLVVGDESYKRDIANDSSNKVYHIAYKQSKYNTDSDQVNNSVPVVIKHKSWFKTASEKLEILIKNITTLCFHNHWSVRFKYLKCIKLLLFKCTETLENCIPVVLPSIFGLSVDNNESISSFAKHLLISFSELSENKNYSLKSIIDFNIEKLVSNLIRHKFTANDDKKLATLKSLLGYIEMSGLAFNKSFSMIHLERIVLTLITLLEFDISDSNLVEEVPNTVIDCFEFENPIFLKKNFKFFKTDEILFTICRLCCSLGNIENCQLLIDYLLDKLSSSDLYELQCIFIIGSIIKGFSNEPKSSEKYSVLINNVLEVFLSSTFLDVPIYRKDDTNLEEIYGYFVKDIPDSVVNKNKIQICLLLEAIARCSECLKTNFRFHLMKVLCPVMEKAGCRNFAISHCGKLCLHFIAKSCKYTSVKELIKDNADYVTNILLINFHQYLYKPEMVTVLHTVITECDKESILLFRDLIFKILDFIDYNQDKAYSLMFVLNLLVSHIRNWFPSEKDYQEHKSLPVNTTGQNLRTSVLEYASLKKCEIKPQDLKDENSQKIMAKSEDVCDTEDNVPNIPLHINIVCDIFKRCILLQSSENRYLRMLILETVELCILALRDFENQLLPLVHEFWSPFLRRFTEDTLVLKAFSVLLTIANECGDFIRHRSLKDIMPKIQLFLQTECNKSALKCNFKHYQWTNDHSLQILVLAEIGNFCTKLDIDDKEINAVVNVCLPYIEKEQPKILQDAAVKSLKALATINSDSIYFYWNILHGEDNTLIPPSNNLLELSFPFSTKS